MTCILVRGANGIVVWVAVLHGDKVRVWRCMRDQFTTAAPTTPAELEAFLVTVATHSAALVGAIAQVTQLVV